MDEGIFFILTILYFAFFHSVEMGGISTFLILSLRTYQTYRKFFILPSETPQGGEEQKTIENVKVE